MDAIEFQTMIKDGIIEIPEMYREQWQKRVRVILLSEESEPDMSETRFSLDVLAAASGQRLFRTAEAVMQHLHEERNSWDR